MIPSRRERMGISEETVDLLHEREETLTREQVLAIAGAPHSQNEDQEYRYYVWNGVVRYSDMFCIEFDNNGRVVWMSF